jgi:hypothetical protein
MSRKQQQQQPQQQQSTGGRHRRNNSGFSLQAIAASDGGENSSGSRPPLGRNYSTNSGGGGGGDGDVLTTTLSQFLADAASPPGTVMQRRLPAAYPRKGSGYALAPGEGDDTDAAAATMSPDAVGGEGSFSPLVCLETSLPLGCMSANGGTVSATLHFLALREGLLSLATLFVFDTNTQIYYRLMQAPTVFACKQ